MAEIEGLVRALREGDDAAKFAAARSLHPLVQRNAANRVLFAEAGGIPPLLELLRDGSAGAKPWAAAALSDIAYKSADNRVLIAEAGGIPLLVELLRDGSADAKLWAAAALGNLVHNNTIRVMVAAAGGIPPLVDLLRDTKSGGGKLVIARVLRNLAHINHANLVAIASDNHANAVAIAVAAGLETLVALARRGRVIVNNQWIVSNATLPAKRKAALVVAALLRDCAPEFKSAPGDIKAAIGSYL